MTTVSPEVTVVMCVLNAGEYLRLAVESILAQTFGDFEFIIVDDGSTDGSGAVIDHFRDIDKRISVYHQENWGLVASRNRACRLAQGRFIAVMDADDVSMPDRLERELRYMQAHPDIGIVGSPAEVINQKGEVITKLELPTAPGVVQWDLIFANCIVHSSVMMRREVVERLGFYSPDQVLAEDYDLWARASFITRIANLPIPLVKYRAWHGGVSSRNSLIVERYVVKTMGSTIGRYLGHEISSDKVESLRNLVTSRPFESVEQIRAVRNLVQQLYRYYTNSVMLTPAELKEVTNDKGRRLQKLALAAGGISLRESLAISYEALRSDLRLMPEICVQVGRQALGRGPRRGYFGE